MNKLRVWHVHQIPMDAFYGSVETPEEAVKGIKLLRDYDEFRYEQAVKPDYSSTSGLEEHFPDGAPEWQEWYHPELGCDIEKYSEILEDKDE